MLSVESFLETDDTRVLGRGREGTSPEGYGYPKAGHCRS